MSDDKAPEFNVNPKFKEWAAELERQMVREFTPPPRDLRGITYEGATTTRLPPEQTPTLESILTEVEKLPALPRRPADKAPTAEWLLFFFEVSHNAVMSPDLVRQLVGRRDAAALVPALDGRFDYSWQGFPVAVDEFLPGQSIVFRDISGNVLGSITVRDEDMPA